MTYKYYANVPQYYVTCTLPVLFLECFHIELVLPAGLLLWTGR